MSTTRDEISINEDVRKKCHLGDHLAMYLSRFVVVSMTRFSIEIGMKGCDFHCRGARVNFGVWDCSRKAGIGLFEGSPCHTG